MSSHIWRNNKFAKQLKRTRKLYFRTSKDMSISWLSTSWIKTKNIELWIGVPRKLTQIRGLLKCPRGNYNFEFDQFEVINEFFHSDTSTKDEVKHLLNLYRNYNARVDRNEATNLFITGSSLLLCSPKYLDHERLPLRSKMTPTNVLLLFS
jgi:hypothetical protein